MEKSNDTVIGTNDSTAHSDIVDFEQPTDKHDPFQWSSRRKTATLTLTSFGAFISTLGTSILSPALDQIITDFGVDNRTLGVFAISVFLLGQSLSPLILSGLSEVYGRAVVLHVCNTLFIGFSVGAALAPNLAALIVFRFLSGFAGAAPITIAGGIVADIYSPAERGKATAIYALGPVFGPAVSPIIAGPLAQTAGWRWVNWFVAILGGAYTITSMIAFRETYAVTILERKAMKLRKSTGNNNLRSKLATDQGATDTLYLALTRPLRMLFFSPVVLITSSALALIAGYLYLLFSTMATVFQLAYNFSETFSGLVYLGLAVGHFLGLAVFAKTSDAMVEKARQKGITQPEVRLSALAPGGLCVCGSLIWYGECGQRLYEQQLQLTRAGWSIQKRVHWIVPIIGTIPFGFGLMCFILPISTYLIDVWKQYAASALAANTCYRSFWGAFIPLVAFDLYKSALGFGWGNTMLGLIAIVTIPVPWLMLRYGEYLRTRFAVQP